MNFRLLGKNITNTTKRARLSRITLVTALAMMMMMFLSLASPSSILSLQQQQAEATVAVGLGDSRLPPAYIVVDGKVSRLQLDNHPFSGEGIADYSRPIQGTISFGERFSLLIPQFPGILKDAQSARMTVCSDETCANDDFHIRQELVHVRDTRFAYTQTHVIAAPGDLGDGFTPSDVGVKVFLWWTVSFTDGTDQTYLAIVLLQGDQCEEHGWVYSRSRTTCFDPNA